MSATQDELISAAINRVNDTDKSLTEVTKSEVLRELDKESKATGEEQRKKYGTCQECQQPNTNTAWCRSCNSNHFRDSFPSWNSGNNNINEFIRNAQLNATNDGAVIEWIPYHRFTDIVYRAEGGFGTIYWATWLDRPIRYWYHREKQWVRYGPTSVALKTLNKSQNITASFLNEITAHLRLFENGSDAWSYFVRCFGITQHPDTKDYIMVLDYFNHGSMRHYMREYSAGISWERRLHHIQNITTGLAMLHSAGLVHRDFHSGNLLVYDENEIAIGDLGLCYPADQASSSSKKIYGVMPYVAPEVLLGKPYTQSSDIYSLGMIMWEMSSGRPPFSNVSYDTNLALQIYNGDRPEIVNGTPACYAELMQRCWHSDPAKRPTAATVKRVVNGWCFDKEFQDAEKIRKSEKEFEVEIHSQAVFTSQLLPRITDSLLFNFYSMNTNIKISELPDE